MVVKPDACRHTAWADTNHYDILLNYQSRQGAFGFDDFRKYVLWIVNLCSRSTQFFCTYGKWKKCDIQYALVGLQLAYQALSQPLDVTVEELSSSPNGHSPCKNRGLSIQSRLSSLLNAPCPSLEVLALCLVQQFIQSVLVQHGRFIRKCIIREVFQVKMLHRKQSSSSQLVLSGWWKVYPKKEKASRQHERSIRNWLGLAGHAFDLSKPPNVGQLSMNLFDFCTIVFSGSFWQPSPKVSPAIRTHQIFASIAIRIRNEKRRRFVDTICRVFVDWIMDAVCSGSGDWAKGQVKSKHTRTSSVRNPRSISINSNKTLNWSFQ